MRLIEIPDDGIISIPIMDGYDIIGHRHIDLEDMPTIDFVRCRECKKHVNSAFHPGMIFCTEHGRCVSTDGYCYLGERKEGAD